jgi:hypothetical protein
MGPFGREALQRPSSQGLRGAGCLVSGVTPGRSIPFEGGWRKRGDLPVVFGSFGAIARECAGCRHKPDDGHARVGGVRFPLALAFAALLASGCLSGPSTTADGVLPDGSIQVPLAFLPSTNVTDPCGANGCFEPAVAVDQQGRIFGIASSGRMDGVAVSTDGGATFTLKPWPPLPDPLPVDESGSAGDDVVQVAPWGTLYMTRLFSDTGGILGGGIHLVGSDDAGDTWVLNKFVHIRDMPLSRSFTADRQWLAFEGDATIHLVFNCAASVLICHTRSDDRGETWSASTNVVTPADHTFPSPAGFPAIGPDGTLLVAYFGDPRPDASTGARSIKVASSSDGGASWSQSTAYTHPLDEGTAGGGWPEATILADGTWVAGWSTSDDRLWLATSPDQGASWGEPLVLSPDETGGASHPWLRPRQDGGFDAVWFGSGPSVILGRFTVDLSYELATLAEEGGGSSDYSFFDHTADDRVAVVYVRPDGGLALTLSNR